MLKHAPGEYYHIFNRGMQKQPIFTNESDRFRFLLTLLTFQADMSVKNLARLTKQSVQSRTLHIDEDLRQSLSKKRVVELVHFCLMPNHFHLMLREMEEEGISRYMQRVMTSYTKYFNIRHDKTGHLFQGSYKSVHIADDDQLMHLSAYIHKNPRELREWKNKEDLYYWSSYRDCLGVNRFEGFINPSIVIDRYEGRKDAAAAYKKFVSTSLAKEDRL